MKNLFTEEKDFNNFISSIYNPLGKSLKIIETFISKKDFEKYANKQGWTLSKTIFGNLFDDIKYIDRTDKKIAIGKTIMHLIGYFYIQEVAASFPVHCILEDLKPNSLILDISSAPGGKSIQIADAMLSKFPDSPGCIISNDVDKKRLIALQTNIERIGLHNITTTLIQGQKLGNYYPETFDIVLLDAPCSGEGTCFKSKDVLTNRKETEIKKIAGLQQELLESALLSCKVGGTIIYSTCTINTIENEENIQKIINKYRNKIEIENINIPNINRGIKEIYKGTITNKETDKMCRLRPHIQKTGGFFVCKIKKLKEIKNNNSKINIKKHQKKTFGNQKLRKEIKNYLINEWGIDNYNKNISFFEFNKTIFATTKKTLENIDILYPQSIGVSILKRTREGFRPLHNFGKLFGKYVTLKDKIIELNDKDMQDYIEHKDIQLIYTNTENKKNKFVIIKWNGFFCSVGKQINKTLKNKFINR